MISIIVSVYNSEKYIINCLNSIINQNYKSFELIIVNDGSTDNSVLKINEFLCDKKIEWKIINKENGGQSSARNLGFNESNGDYIVFLDSDDVISPNFLTNLISYIDDTVDFVFCNYAFVKVQIPPVDNANDIQILSRDKLLNLFLRRKISFLLPTMLIKREYIMKNQLVFNEKIRFSEDQMYMWNLIFHSNKSIYINKKLYGYFVRNESIMTGSSANKIKDGFYEYRNFVESLFEKYKEDENIIKYILPRWELGTLYTSANILVQDEFLDIYKLFNAKTLILRMKGSGDIKAYLLSLIAWLSPKLLYIFCRGLKLNG